ncbi:MAG: N-methyl-L-tryptophan oxidase [Solirubrobacteraceae bacterium]
MPAVATSDVIVIGLGAMGSATCLQLATRGVSVLGIDQHRPPHSYGSTHGETRITRLAIGEGPEYVPLVRRSHELWRELEEQTGSRLLTPCGGLIIGNEGNEFVAQTRACARQYGIEHEDLSAAELAHRFPMFAVDQTAEAYYEPTAGYLRPEAAVKAQLELAARRGAQLRLGERADRWMASPQGVTVTTPAGTYTAGRLVVCVGAWIARLLPEVADTFAVHRQLMYWFAIREGYEQLRGMPIFVWDFGGQKDAFVHFHGFYGFPAIDGPAGGVKVGSESYEHTTTADEDHQPPSEREALDMYRSYVARGLPWLGPELLRAAPCLYTSTRASRFVIDCHPDHDTVWIVSPCSGHGFKHSPAIGEAVAQQLTAGECELDLSPFRLARARD